MSDTDTICIRGSAVMAPTTTTEYPYVLNEDGGVTYRGVPFFTFTDGWLGPVISWKDQVRIVKALNISFQNGYHDGFVAPKYLPRT
jgi:hypothetical protein